MSATKALAVATTAYPPMFTETICGCFGNVHICCEEVWCSYCHLGTLWDYLTTGRQSMDPLVCCGACFIDFFFTLGIARCLVAMSLRNKMFDFYNFDRVHEGNCSTCCISCWCTTCSMCQMHRELHNRGNYPGGVCCYSPPDDSHPVPAMGAPMGHKEQPQAVPAAHYQSTQPYPHDPAAKPTYAPNAV